MNSPESPVGPDDDPIEIELSSTLPRRERGARTHPKSRQWTALTLVAIVSGVVGFAVARSTDSDGAQVADPDPTEDSGSTATGDKPAEVSIDSGNDSISASETSKNPASSSTGSASTVPTTEFIIEYSSSADVLEFSLDENGELIVPATYVGPDGVDSRLAGQPIEIVAQTKAGLVDVNLALVDPNQTESALVPVGGETDDANGGAVSADVKAAGPDWIVVGNDWDSLELLREGNEPLVLTDDYGVGVEWPDGESWGWTFDFDASDSQMHRIGLDGAVVEGSTITVPTFDVWLLPGRRLVGAYGGAVVEFTADGERPLGRGYPIATGAHTTIVERCGDQLVCELFAVDLDTGKERLLGDTELAADLVDYQSPSMSPDDRYVALSKSDVTVIVDLVNGQLVASISGLVSDDLATTSAWSDDGRWWFFNDDSDGPSALDTTTGERFPIFDPTLDIDPWTSLAVRSP